MKELVIVFMKLHAAPNIQHQQLQSYLLALSALCQGVAAIPLSLPLRVFFLVVLCDGRQTRNIGYLYGLSALL